MRKMSEEGNEKVPDTAETKGRKNTRRRKNTGQDETQPEPKTTHVRRRKRTPLVETPTEPQKFDVHKLKTGDKFSFLAPGKGKKSYICTVQGDEVLFERDDKHTYTRHLHELPGIITSCKLECTLVK